MTIQPPQPADSLFERLRSLTALRLRAATRGDDGLVLLIGREREACLATLRAEVERHPARRIAA